MRKARELKAGERKTLLETLKRRFEDNPGRHEGLDWVEVQARLEAAGRTLRSLFEMEATGGEPDVIGHDRKTGEYVFCDCSKQSPKGRRSVCYDREALEKRKEHKPKDSAVAMAAAMGIALLTEEGYRELQELGEFDTTTSSWVVTPRRSAGSAGPSSAIAATPPSSCTTTAPSRTTLLEGSAAR